MASRKTQKEAARERRLAEERTAALKARRTRRLQMTGGVIAAAIVVVVVLVIVSSGGGGSKGKAINPNSAQATAAAKQVDTLLKGIPQHGNTLGSSKAPVTVTEYGDLVCPVCQSFALGAEQQVIQKDVRQGKVKLVYKALETASQEANNAMFVPSQTAVLAAGQQKLGWNYIELFYHEQQDETKSYVTTAFLQGLAKQVSGLNYSKWNSDRGSATLKNQVLADGAAAQSAGYSSTPTILVQGPVSQGKPIEGVPTYGQLEKEINSVAT